MTVTTVTAVADSLTQLHGYLSNYIICAIQWVETNKLVLNVNTAKQYENMYCKYEEKNGGGGCLDELQSFYLNKFLN